MTILMTRDNVINNAVSKSLWSVKTFCRRRHNRNEDASNLVIVSSDILSLLDMKPYKAEYIAMYSESHFSGKCCR